MLKTIRSSVALVSRADDNEVISSGAESGSSIGGLVISREKLTKSKNQNLKGNSNTMEEPKFLNSKTRKAFNYLRQTFTKTLIF